MKKLLTTRCENLFSIQDEFDISTMSNSSIKPAFLFQFRLNASADERNPATEPLLPPQQNRFIISGMEHIRQYSRQMFVPSLYRAALSLNIRRARESILCPFIGQGRTIFVPSIKA